MGVISICVKFYQCADFDACLLKALAKNTVFAKR